MKSYEIIIKSNGDATSALSAAVTILKALNMENINVDCGNGITVLASKDSRIVDLCKIYYLEEKLLTKGG